MGSRIEVVGNEGSRIDRVVRGPASRNRVARDTNDLATYPLVPIYSHSSLALSPHLSSGDWDEFFVGMLQPEVHFVQVKTVNDIVPAVQRLRANTSHARRIAAAGRAFAL